MARHQQQPNQLTLNFAQTVMPAEPVPMAPLSLECLGIIHAHMPPPDLSDILSRNAPLPQAWNFRDEFPSPLPEAVAEGVFGEDELTAQNIEAIHVERANELLGLLDEITACEKAKLHGVDPQTGKVPRTAATRRRLMERLQQAPGLLRAQFDDASVDAVSKISCAAICFLSFVDILSAILLWQSQMQYVRKDHKADGERKSTADSTKDPVRSGNR